MHGLHGPDIRGVRPYQVIGLVWFANVVGSGILIVEIGRASCRERV